MVRAQRDRVGVLPLSPRPSPRFRSQARFEDRGVVIAPGAVGVSEGARRRPTSRYPLRGRVPADGPDLIVVHVDSLSPPPTHRVRNIRRYLLAASTSHTAHAGPQARVTRLSVRRLTSCARLGQSHRVTAAGGDSDPGHLDAANGRRSQRATPCRPYQRTQRWQANPIRATPASDPTAWLSRSAAPKRHRPVTGLPPECHPSARAASIALPLALGGPKLLVGQDAPAHRRDSGQRCGHPTALRDCSSHGSNRAAEDNTCIFHSDNTCAW
jgi:hypothetical protein